MDYFLSGVKQFAQVAYDVAQSAAATLVQEQLQWETAFARGQLIIPATSHYGLTHAIKEDYLCGKLSKRVYNETEWVQTETTAEVRDGIHYWADLDAEPLPVDAAGWAERRTDMGLGRADKDISQYAVDDMGTRVISVENPRCVIYEPPGAGDVVYVAFRGTLTRDDINVILAHALAEFTIGGRKPLLAHEGMAYILNTIWPQLDAALASYSGRRIVFTGHSLGGALAILACTRSVLSRRAGSRDRARFSAVTFGAPLVLAHTERETRLDAKLFDDLKPHIRNYIYTCDIVPRLLGKGLSKAVIPLVHSDYLSSWSTAFSQHGQQLARSLSQYSPVGTFYYLKGVLERPDDIRMYRFETYDAACGVANQLDIVTLQLGPTRGLADHKICLYMVALSQATRRALKLPLPRYMPPPIPRAPEPEPEHAHDNGHDHDNGQPAVRDDAEL